MPNIPAALYYSRSHEWVKIEDDGNVTIGITDHAQAALGDVVFVELPMVGTTVTAGEAIAVIESVKAASDIYAPFTGAIVAVNTALQAAPESVNSAPYQDGWLFTMKQPSEDVLATLLDAEGYGDFIANG